MEDIVEWYQELALRVAVMSALEKGETKKVGFYGERVEDVDKIRHMVLFVVWAVVGYLPMICVVVMAWGVHRLPREFTMDPLELAYMLMHRTARPEGPTIDGEIPGPTTLVEVVAACPGDASISDVVKFTEEWDESVGRGKLVRFGLIEGTGSGRYGIYIDPGYAGLGKAGDEMGSIDGDFKMEDLAVVEGEEEGDESMA